MFWINKKVVPLSYRNSFLNLLPEDLNTKLKALLGDQALVDRWWYSPNNAFDGKCPKDKYLVDPYAVIDYINAYLLR